MLARGATEQEFSDQLRAWAGDPFYRAQYVKLLAESSARIATMTVRKEPAALIAKEQRFATLLTSILGS